MESYGPLSVFFYHPIVRIHWVNLLSKEWPPVQELIDILVYSHKSGHKSQDPLAVMIVVDLSYDRAEILNVPGAGEAPCCTDLGSGPSVKEPKYMCLICSSRPVSDS